MRVLLHLAAFIGLNLVCLSTMGCHFARGAAASGVSHLEISGRHHSTRAYATIGYSLFEPSFGAHGEPNLPTGPLSGHLLLTEELGLIADPAGYLREIGGSDRVVAAAYGELARQRSTQTFTNSVVLETDDGWIVARLLSVN